MLSFKNVGDSPSPLRIFNDMDILLELLFPDFKKKFISKAKASVQ